MIKITPFEIADAEKVELREADQWLTSWIPSQAILHKENGIGFTIKKNEQIIMCIGADVLWNGVGEVWALISVHYRPLMFTMQRIVKEIIESFFKVHGLHRLQSPIPESNGESVRYAESFGFVREGVLKMFDSKKADYVMFARYEQCHG